MNNLSNMKLGTRDSLLAKTQSTLIKNEIEKNTGLTFDLHSIKTQGDQITDKPLWQLDGKDFFTKELDKMLIENQVDLVVHSYKDLGSERPPQIELAAITKRNYPNDILLIKKSKLEELSSLESFIVGTSSPRRIQNINHSLKDYLPNIKESLEVSCKVLRGNVNTRIQKLRDDKYDAIVLAHAGLERLALKAESSKILEELLEGITFMIMPQKDFPSSASQGALALEINKSASNDLRNAIKTVHCEKTSLEIEQERKVFNSFGGGCHLAVGIHVKTVHDYKVCITKGIHENNIISEEEIMNFDYSNLQNKSAYFVFSDNDFLISKIPIQSDKASDNLFVTSSNCFHNVKNYETLWTAGSRSTKALTKMGHWINGSSEGFGDKEIEKLKNSKSLQAMINSRTWKVLSHSRASSSLGEVLPSYSHQINEHLKSSKLEEIKNADIIYWSSEIQYKEYIKQIPEIKNKLHACGLGKTYEKLKKHNIEIIPFISMNHMKDKIKG